MEEFYTNGEMWVTNTDGWRIGVRTWCELDDSLLEIVYEEFDSGNSKWVEKNSIHPVNKVMLQKLAAYGVFLIESMENKA